MGELGVVELPVIIYCTTSQWHNNVVKGPWRKQMKGSYFCYNRAGRGGEGGYACMWQNMSNLLQKFSMAISLSLLRAPN